MAEIIDLEEERIWREIAEDEAAINEAVTAACIQPGDERILRCPNGPHQLECVGKRRGERGDVKVQYFCNDCGLGGEGWF